MNNLATRTPNLIAKEINSIKEQTRKMVLYNSIEIGRKLVEAKELLAHGEWGDWLKTEVDYSKSTANNLMKIFEEYGAEQITLLGDNAKSQAFGELSYSQAIILLGVPAEQREEFIETHEIEDMSTRELKKVVKELEESRKENKEMEQKLEEAIKEKDDIEETNRALEEAFNEGAEERNKLTSNIKALEDKITELSNKEMVIDVQGSEVEKELQEKIDKLKIEKEEAERKLNELNAAVPESIIRFKIHFDLIVNNYQKLLEELANIKNNELEYARYKNATKKFLETMKDKLE